MSKEVAIRFEAVTKEHRSPAGEVVLALSGFDLDVNAGQTTCLIGRSGSGKSTALKLVNRMEEPTTGRVTVFGEDIATVDPIPLRRKIGYVIQSVGLFPHLTIAANVGILGRATGRARKQIAERVDELLTLVRLDPAEFRDRYPSELSGGQRQRAGVARALFADPPLILLDEPFGALDPITRTALHEEFEALTRSLKKTILLVTHDIEEAYRLGDVIALIDEGRLVQSGSPEDFRLRPANDFVAQFVQGALR